MRETKTYKEARVRAAEKVNELYTGTDAETFIQKGIAIEWYAQGADDQHDLELNRAPSLAEGETLKTILSAHGLEVTLRQATSFLISVSFARGEEE